MQGDAAEKLTERLARFASGAAYVSATAEVTGPMTRLERIAQIETPDLGAPVRASGAPSRPGRYAVVRDLADARDARRRRSHRRCALRGFGAATSISIEHRVLKRLSRSGIKLGRSADAKRRGYALSEDLALMLGLLFRTLAPMRSRDNMRAVAEGIEAMEREEAAYWLGMAMHRRHPRRVLTALRVLLAEPRPRRGAGNAVGKPVSDAADVGAWHG